MKVSNWKIIVALATVYVVWGSTFLAIRVAVATLPPFLLAAMRFLAAGLLLYAIGVWQSSERPAVRHWTSAAIIGILLLVTGNGIVVWAEKRVASGLAALIISTVPLWMVCLPMGIRGSPRPKGRVLIGIAIGLIGVFLLMPHSRGQLATGDGRAYLALLSAALSWSIGTLYAKRAVLPRSSAMASGMEMMVGGVVLLGLSGIFGEWTAFLAQPPAAAAWWGLGYLILFGSVIAFSAYMWLTTRISTALLATYAYVNPVVAIFLGSVFLHEPVTPQMVGSAAVILGGVALISWSK